VERTKRLTTGEVVVPRGTYSTYFNWGCRCEDCREANRKVKRKNKQPLSSSPPDEAKSS